MDIFKSFGSDKLNEYLTINEIKQHLMHMRREKSTSINNRKIEKIKNVFCYENYLVLPFYLRNPLIKLRISYHQLQIETGRYNLLPLPLINQCNCFSCKNKIEDELHFLFDCDSYHSDLQEYNNMISCFQFLNSNIDSLSNDEKWIFVSTIYVNDHYANCVLCSFVVKSFIIRKSSINN